MGQPLAGEFPAARNRLLEQKIELRRAMEAVAAARRRLPPGGIVLRDYVFHTQGPDGHPAEVRLSELFAPGTDSLVIYSMMFPGAPGDDRPGERADRAAAAGAGPVPVVHRVPRPARRGRPHRPPRPDHPAPA
jgi:predicted dithiol-disulfide oxidoreductase (DUF899 family)